MKLKIIKNFIKSPLKIYDGFEPSQIIFRGKSIDDKLSFKIDIWNLSRSYKKLFEINKKELRIISKLLNLPINDDFYGDGSCEERMIFRFPDKGIELPVSLIRFKSKDKEYIVAFILSEMSPLRYQCYILALIQIEP